jgi:hypothetical protein
MLQKSTLPIDTSLSSYGNIQFKQKNYHEKIINDVTCNELFLYKTPSLTDDGYQGKSMKNYDKSLIDNSESCNKRNKEIQNTIKPISSVLSALEADKNRVAEEPTAKR